MVVDTALGLANMAAGLGFGCHRAVKSDSGLAPLCVPCSMLEGAGRQESDNLDCMK